MTARSELDPVRSKKGPQFPKGLVIILSSIIGAVGTVVASYIGGLRAAEGAAKPAAAAEVRSEVNLLLGTVVASMVPPEAFAAVDPENRGFDVKAAKWVPADGRDVAGSLYAQRLHRSTVPDLRGLFLRGLNYSETDLLRTDVYADVDSRRSPGGVQMDAFQGHGHRVQLGTEHHADQGTFSNVDGRPEYAAYRIFEPTTIDSFGPARIARETRPKNAAVFYYVRIN